MTLEPHVSEAASPWMHEGARDQDVVISSRVRLARNVKGFTFPDTMSETAGDGLIDAAAEAVVGLGPKWGFFRLKEVRPVDLSVLVEKHLISPQLAQAPRFHALGLTEDEDQAVMVNEEDHLRIQAFACGLDLEGAWKKAEKTDTALEEKLGWAFDDRLGFLTACPTNVGTGLRVSVMVHVPGLIVTEEGRQLMPVLAKMGIAVRGLFGEGTQPLGGVFQVSNQVTLGQSEAELLEGIARVALQIVGRERQARERLAQERMPELSDRVFRARGILENARLLSAEEAIEKISTLRLGREMGLVKKPRYETLEALMVMSLPGYLERVSGQTLSRGERLALRASLIRERLLSEEADD